MKKERATGAKGLDPSRILFEDNHLIALYKAPGDIVQGDRTGDLPLSEMLELFIRKRDAKPGNAYVGVIHRLDRPVSGVLLFAKTGKGLSRMNRAFQEKEVEKGYWAVVEGIQEGRARLEDRLIKDPKKNRSRSVLGQPKGSRDAVLDYEVIGKGDHYSLLEVSPKTGRHHQIRVQLSQRGMPIKGDVKYGARRPNPDASIHLHARWIRFPHPTREEVLTVTAAPPSEDALWDLFSEKKGPAHS